MPPIKTFGERIADALVEDGLLTPVQIQELLEQQKKDGTRLLKLILEKSYVKEMDMVVSMGRVLNTPPVNLARVGIPQDVAELVPREIAENHKVLPVSRLGDRLFLAMADPLNVLALDDVKRITKLEVTPLIASEKAIVDKLNNLETAKSSMEEIISDAAKQAEAVGSRLHLRDNGCSLAVVIGNSFRFVFQRARGWLANEFLHGERNDQAAASSSLADGGGRVLSSPKRASASTGCTTSISRALGSMLRSRNLRAVTSERLSKLETKLL